MSKVLMESNDDANNNTSTLQSIGEDGAGSTNGNETNKATPDHEPLHSNPNTCTSNKHDAEKLEEELQHLNRRIRHIQESIQFSTLTTALLDPQIWQENCLFAVKNCVNEWRSIVKFHFPPPTNTSTNTDNNGQEEEEQEDKRLLQSTNYVQGCEKNQSLDDQKIKSIGLKIFGLIQMALQVGPLKGSNPGYFKRCGSNVAKMAQEFLRECLGHTIQHDDEICIDGDELRFTERQTDCIKKWYKNASQAVKANKAPSKSALKLQQSASSKKSQKKKKKKAT